MKPAKFDVHSRKIGDTAIVYPRGYLNNITGEKLVKECNACLEQGVRTIVLSFKEMDFINSIGISMILAVIEKLKACGGQIYFTDLARIYQETFDMLGLTKTIRVLPTEAEALTFLSGEARR